ncbi:MAG: aldo/keto reductase [Oscillospiraceae bacterium]
MLNKYYTLSNGVTIPKIALGTWQVSNEDVQSSISNALSIGYRHIDTAAAYENEKGVGTAIQKSGIARNALFITTKIPAEIKTYEGTVQVIEKSLANLQTDYIDLMLIHSPKPWKELFARTDKTYFKENLSVWKALTEYYKAGKLRAIGVSNFEIADIQNIIDNAEIKPMVNQVRVHIGHTPKEIINYCQSRNILIEAFSPNATGKLHTNPVVVEIAEKYGVSIPQLGIRYDLQLGTLPLPKTTHKEYMIQNEDVDFVISDEDMARLGEVEEISSL